MNLSLTKRSNTATPQSGRILELDALRGIAAIAVVLFHYTTRYEELFGHTSVLPMPINWGHYGVDLFFMLSGFVMLMTLGRSSETVKFAWGRFTRLYPAYWASVAVTFSIVAFFGLSSQEVSLSSAVLNLTMVQALIGTPHVDGAYWSLQAELIFYFNIFLLYRIGAFRWPTATIAGWVGIAMLVNAAQIFTDINLPLIASFLSKLVTIASLKFIGLFSIGILLFDARHRNEPLGNRWYAMGLCFASVAFRSGLTAMFVDVGLALLLMATVSGVLPWLQSKSLIFLGAISYTLYLTHQNIGYIVIGSLERIGFHPLAAIMAAIAVAMVLAVAIHRLIERPALQRLRTVDISSYSMKLRQRFFAAERTAT